MDKFYRFVKTLDPMCEVYAKSGITLAYHHHNWEYIKLSSGKTRMEELLSRTSKIKFVHDTYWTAGCGISPVSQIEEFGERLLGIHLRDLSHEKRGLKVVAKNTYISGGVINFKEVLASAEKVGCVYYVIEEKTDEPYQNIQKSFACLETVKSRIENEE